MMLGGEMKVNGFSLIEVMISCFIMAIALLGLASMQSGALKIVGKNQQISLANSLLVDISERMRLNHRLLEKNLNSYDILSIKGSEYKKPTCVTDGKYTQCSRKDIRDNDLFEWRMKMLNAGVDKQETQGLINADACIKTDLKGIVTVVLSWGFSAKEEGGTNINLNMTCEKASKHQQQVSIKYFVSGSDE